MVGMNMKTMRSWMRRVPEQAAEVVPEHGLTPEVAVTYLDDELATTLGNLDGAPAGIADSVMQLLPLGSRASVLQLGIVEEIPVGADDDTYGLRVTSYGYQVILAAARHNDADPSAVRDWTEQATLAARAFEESEV
jgi:hypothetical protein